MAADGRSIPEPVPDPTVALEVASGSGDRLARALRGFGPVGMLGILVVLAASSILPLRGIAVLLWARVSRTPWREIGYVRPRSWIGGLAAGLVFGVAFKLVMKTLVMPLLGAGPINPAYHYLAGDTAALPAMLFGIIVGAGFGEETLYRGWMFERLGKLLGSSAGAKAAIVLLTSALFAAAHYPEQGLAGAEQAAVTGLVFGTIFAATGQLWMLMCAHAAFDLAALAIIYFNLETDFAHLIFR
jgi:membrane protease YdiL (CAAX protease family)